METDNPFEKVLDRLREKGWCKDRLGDRHGPNCLLGGAREVNVLGGEWLFPLEEIIVDQYTDRVRNIAHTVSFNNHPDTTFTDVERVLEKAAVKWEEERVMRND